MDGNASSLHNVKSTEMALQENDNIAEHMRSNDRLAFQAQLLSTVHDAIIAVDENMSITYWNGVAEEVTGWTAKEATELSGKEIFHRLGVDSNWPVFTEQLDEVGVYSGEIVAIRKNGSPVIIDLHMKRIFGVGGDFKGTVSTLRDVTERKKLDEALRASEEMLRTVLDMSLDGITRFNYQIGLFDYLSPASAGILGYSVEELLYFDKAAMHAAVHPDDVPGMLAGIKLLEETGEATSEYRQMHKDGRYIWLSNHMSIVRDGEGSPVFRYGSIRDITERRRTEEALRESEEKYRTLFSSIDEGFAVLELLRDDRGQLADFIYLEANKSFEQNSRLHNVVGKKVRDLFPKLEQSWLDFIQRVSDTGEPVLAENYSVDLDRWFEFRYSCLGEAGSPFIVAVFTDITERKKAEQALRESEERQKYLLKLSDALKELVDPREIQETACRLIKEKLGTEQSSYTECYDDKGYYIVQTEDAEETGPQVKGVYKEEDYTVGLGILRSGALLVVDDTMNTNIIPKAEAEKWFAYKIGAQISVPLIKNGRLIATLAVKQSHPRTWVPFEVSLVQETAERTWAAVERVRAEEALRESEVKVRAFLQASTSVVFRMSADWRTMTELHGKGFLEDTSSPDSKWLDKYIYPADQPHVLEAVREAIRIKSMFSMEYRVLRADGGIGWTYSQVIPITDGHGEIVEWFGTAADITERKRVGEALRESEEKYRELVEHANSIIIRMNKEGKISSFNEYALSYFGYSRDEAVGMNIRMLVPQTEDISGRNLKEMSDHILENPDEFVVNTNENIKKNGEHVWVSWRNKAIRNVAGEVIGNLAIGQDVTQLKWAEEALRDNEARLQELSRDLAAEVDALRLFHQINTRFIRQEEIESVYSDILDAAISLTNADCGNLQLAVENGQVLEIAVHAGLSDAFIQYFHRVSNDKTACAKVLKDRARAIVDDVSVSPVFDDASIRKVMLAEGICCVQSTPMISGTGSFMGVFSTHYKAAHEFSERDLRVFDLLARQAADVIDSARMEKALQEREEQAHLLAEELDKKNRLVTDFFINISHEFKTPLTILMMGLELLETKARRVDGGNTFLGNLTAMKQNSYRLNRLVANLLDITKLDAGFMQPKWDRVDVAAMFGSLAQSVEPYARQKQLVLEYDCNVEKMPFATDCFMLERIALNLLSNAIKHTPAGGRIDFTCRANGCGITISVSDTGEGIPEDKKAIIFDRFSQVDTRMTRASEGTGIGLALIKSLVELLGGKISVESEPGKGSTFTVELPMIQMELTKGGVEQGGMQIEKRVQMELSDVILQGK